jgi:hypothetical protein
VRCLTAALLPGLAALGVVLALDRAAGTSTTGSLLGTVAGGTVLLVGYLAAARRLRVPEVEQLAAPVLARVGR